MKSIVITGAAGGLGRAVAERFLAEGWLVGAYDLHEPDLPGAVTGVLDVTDADAWDRVLAEFAEHSGGKIDVLDNNAGVIIEGPLADADVTGVDGTIAVNVLGVTLGARAAHPYLKKAKGTLVGMASAAAIHGQPGVAVYSATKFYVNGLTEALSLEWRRDGIRVIDVNPLWAKTPLADNGAASVRRLGVRITPEQVAERVWRAVHPANAWERGAMHYGVSRLDRFLLLLGGFAPDRMRRFLTGLIAG